MYLSLLQSLQVPTMSDKSKKQSQTVSRKTFTAACQQSQLPLCMGEAVMLAELLSRNHNLKSRDMEAEDSESVDISLLNKIKRGEFINAPLQ